MSPNLQCIACLIAVSEIDASSYRGSCGHVMCAECLKKQCLLSLRDRRHFPAHCCKPQSDIPLNVVRRVLDSDQLEKYERFLEESKGIPASKADCAYEKTIQCAAFKICPKCRTGVERLEGCLHMRCVVCKCDFCYKCGVAYNTSKTNCNYSVCSKYFF